MSLVTAIVPAFNRPELTVAAVAGLRAQSRPPEEILVVDDGSEHPLPELPARVIRHPRNLGFAAAVNTGIRASQTPLLAIVNNDVTLHAEFLERLTGAINYQDASFACGKLYRPDGRLDSTWNLIVRGGLAWQAGHGRADSELFSAPKPVRACSFTAVVVKAEAFRTAGLLDESYGTFYEDVEWMYRAGVTGRFVPEATGVHLGSATALTISRFSETQLLRNHRRFAFQHLLPEYQREYRVARTLLRTLQASKGFWPGDPAEPAAAKPRSSGTGALLLEMEQELFYLQKVTGYDSLWRWYQRLTQ